MSKDTKEFVFFNISNKNYLSTKLFRYTINLKKKFSQKLKKIQFIKNTKMV